VITCGGRKGNLVGGINRVVVLDPANSDNNVARRMTDTECREIIGKASEAWERLTEARNNNYENVTIECWKDVFGRSFSIED
jgi:hypothetical protein